MSSHCNYDRHIIEHLIDKAQVSCEITCAASPNPHLWLSQLLSLSLSPPHPTREHLTFFPLLQLIQLVASPCIILFSSSHHTHVIHLLGLSCLQLNFFLSFKSLTAISSHIYFIIYSIFHRIKIYFCWVIKKKDVYALKKSVHWSGLHGRIWL